MRAMTMLLATALAATVWHLPAVAAEPMTREQGDAILRELQAIRVLLEQEPGKPAPAGSAAMPATLRIPVRDRLELGDPSAPLILVEFTDYQCTFCRRFHETAFPEIKKQYIDTGKLRFISMDLPLDFHLDAAQAAHAAWCAGEQGLFWALRDRLIRNPGELDAQGLERHAAEAGVAPVPFRQCMASGKFRQRVDADVKTARGAGITGTPTFIIGLGRDGWVSGRKVVGSQPFATFAKLIDEELKSIASDGGRPNGAEGSPGSSDKSGLASGTYRLEMRRVQ